MVRIKIKQKIKNCRRGNSKNYARMTLLLLIIALVVYFSFNFLTKAFAAPPDSPYSLGETLAPTCAPGDGNCYVAIPGFSQTNSDITAIMGSSGDTRIGIGTSTPMAFLDVYPKGQNINLFAIGSTSPGSVMLAQKNGYIGIGTTSPYYLMSVGNDLNLKTGSAYRIGGIIAMTAASSTQINSAARSSGGFSQVNLRALQKIYVLGDDLADNSYQQYLNSRVSTSTWDIVDQVAVGSETTGNILSELQNYVITQNDAGYVIIWAGAVDIAYDTASTTIESNLQSMYTAAHNIGAKVVSINIAPWKDSASWTSTRQKATDDVNTWIANTAANIDFKIDSHTLLASSTDSNRLKAAYDSGDHYFLSSAGFDRVASSTYLNVTWTPPSTANHKLSYGGDIYLDQSLRQSDSVAFAKLSVNKIQSYYSNGYKGGLAAYGPLLLNSGSGGSGTVGIGIASPDTTVKLNVEGGTAYNGMLVATTKSSGYAIIAAGYNGTGLFSVGSPTAGVGIYSTGGVNGAEGDSSTHTGYGVLGYSTYPTTYGGYAVYGEDESTNGYGVMGVSTNGTGVGGNGGLVDFYSDFKRSRFATVGLHTDPVNQLDVLGSAAMGTYAGTQTAPNKGLIVSGNVGIGTSNPTTALQVGYARTGTAGENGDRYIYMPVGSETSPAHNDTAGVYFDGWNYWTDTYGGDQNFYTYHGIQIIGSSLNGSASDPYFQVKHYQTTDLAISLAGKVGVGTTSPASELTVYGNMAIGSYDSTAAPANGLLVSGSSGIATSSSYFTANVGGDVNLKNGNVFRKGGIALPGAASSTTWTGFKGGALAGKQIFTGAASTTGTYTPTSGTLKAIVELWGPGGGGAGCNDNGSAGGGGGSGGYALYYLTGVSGTYSYQIGKGGQGSGNANGANGISNTTFTNGGTIVTAFAGSGGTYIASSSAFKFAAGGAGAAVSTSGTINAAGAPGAAGITGSSTNATLGISGSGGSTSLGGAGISVNVSNANTAGKDAVTGTGSGGSGAACGAKAAGARGGTGAGGAIIIWEYK